MLVTMLMCLCFPVGIWFGLEGYEIPSLILLIIGWIRPAASFAVVLESHRKEAKVGRAKEGRTGTDHGYSRTPPPN